MRRKIDFVYTVEILRQEYERAKSAEYVRKPISYALYKTWKIVEELEKERRRDE